MVKLLLQILFIGALSLACTRNNTDKDSTKPEIVFNQEQWQLKEGKDYPYREKMYKAIVYNDTIRNLNKPQILNLLGTPTKTVDEYVYYRVQQTRLLGWPLHTRTVVFKFKEDKSIEWIKIHE